MKITTNWQKMSVKKRQNLKKKIGTFLAINFTKNACVPEEKSLTQAVSKVE